MDKIIEEKDTSTESTVEINEQEQIARAKGWKPKEEAVELVESGKWVDYEEFNRRGEFFDAIHKANQRSKRLEDQLNKLMDHHNRVEQAAYERAKKELIDAKKVAARDQNLERMVEIDEQLDGLKPPATSVPTTTTTTRNPDLDEFISRNKWYEEDEDLQAFANGIGARLERANPDMPLPELLKKVEEKVKNAFPSKFQTGSTVPAVTPSRTGGSASTSMRKNKNITYADLPDEAKKVYNALVKSPRNPGGKMSETQYLKEYALHSGLPYTE